MTSMEESWTSWLCDMEPDDYTFINESDMNLDDGSFSHHHDIAAVVHEENPEPSFSTESHCSYPTFNTENTSTMRNSSVDESSLERASKVLKIYSSNSAITEHLSQKPASSPYSYILSFNNVIPPQTKVESTWKPETKVVNHERSLPSKNEPKRVVIQEGKKTGSVARSTHHAHDHILAERMRREKISQQFIALSALIPGLKKMDKATVLGDAIKYMKQLKEQVKLLEEQTKRKSIESALFMKKSQLSANEDVSDTSSNCYEGISDDPSKTNQSLPKVEVRVLEKNMLIRIYCVKQKVVLVDILREIEKLHLLVINSSSLLFSSSFLDITIMAQMEDEFSMGVKELARKIRVGLLQFM